MIPTILHRALPNLKGRTGFAALAAAFLFFAAQPALAHDFKAGDIEIAHPWSRVTPTGAKVAAGYLTLHNKGAEADTLLSATADIAGRVEIHEMAVKDGIMTMREITDGLEVPAGGEVKLAPGGYHLMLMDLKEAPSIDKPFDGTLTFSKSGTVKVQFKVEPMSGPKSNGHGASAGTGH